MTKINLVVQKTTLQLWSVMLKIPLDIFIIFINIFNITYQRILTLTLTSIHRQLGSPFSLTAHSLPAPQNTLAHTLLLLCSSWKKKKKKERKIVAVTFDQVLTTFKHRAALLHR